MTWRKKGGGNQKRKEEEYEREGEENIKLRAKGRIVNSKGGTQLG